MAAAYLEEQTSLQSQNSERKDTIEANFVEVEGPDREKSNSGVFRYIKHLKLPENASQYQELFPKNIVTSVDLFSKGERQAYILKLSTPPETHLFQRENFVFSERHLSCDKRYARHAEALQQLNTRSVAHYTETYSCRVNENTIVKRVVHAYYNHSGHCLGIQCFDHIKDNSTKPARRVAVKLNQDQELEIKKNSRIATTLLKDIIESRAAIIKTQADEIKKCEEELDDLRKKLNRETIEQYKLKAKNLIQLIEKRNKLADKIDKRGERLQEFLNTLETRFLVTHAPSTDIESAGDASPASTEVTGDALPSLKTKEDVFIEKLKSMEAELDQTLTIPDIIEKSIKTHQHAEAIDEEILAFELQATLQKKRNQKYVASLKDKIERLKKNLISLFEKYVEEGNLPKTQELFPYVERLLTFSFFSGFCLLLTEAEETLCLKLTKIFDYFCEASPDYRQFISIQHNILLCLDEIQRKNLLAICIIKKNLIAFEAFLKQGARADCAGDVYRKKDKLCSVSLLVLVCERKNLSNRHQWVQLLLQYGANPQDGILILDSNSPRHRAYVPELPHFLSSIPSVDSVEDELNNKLFDYYFNNQNSLSLYCNSLDNLEAVQLLIGSFRCKEIILALSAIINTPGTMHRLMDFLPVTAEQGVRVVKYEELTHLTMALSSDGNSLLFGLSMLIYFKENEGVKISIVQELINNIQKRCLGKPLVFLERLYDQFFAQGNEAFSPEIQKVSLAKSNFTACILVLLLKQRHHLSQSFERQQQEFYLDYIRLRGVYLKLAAIAKANQLKAETAHNLRVNHLTQNIRIIFKSEVKEDDFINDTVKASPQRTSSSRSALILSRSNPVTTTDRRTTESKDDKSKKPSGKKSQNKPQQDKPLTLKEKLHQKTRQGRR